MNNLPFSIVERAGFGERRFNGPPARFSKWLIFQRLRWRLLQNGLATLSRSGRQFD